MVRTLKNVYTRKMVREAVDARNTNEFSMRENRRALFFAADRRGESHARGAKCISRFCATLSVEDLLVHSGEDTGETKASSYVLPGDGTEI